MIEMTDRAYQASGTSTFDFTGRVAVVTGASRGIGACISEAMARAGANLVVHGRDATALEDRLGTLRSLGARAVAVQGDVRDPGTSDNLVGAALEAFGRIDVLVNNAGGNFSSRLESLSENGWRALIETNLSSVFYSSKACWPVFVEQGGGVIVNVGSISSEYAHPNRAAYAAAKAGVTSLTKTMAWEWAPANIRVNCLSPGAINTEASRFADEEVERLTTQYIPLGRIGDPGDIANACLFLCSDAASYITGEVLHVHGGPLTAMPGDALTRVAGDKDGSHDK